MIPNDSEDPLGNNQTSHPNEDVARLCVDFTMKVYYRDVDLSLTNSLNRALNAQSIHCHLLMLINENIHAPKIIPS